MLYSLPTDKSIFFVYLSTLANLLNENKQKGKHKGVEESAVLDQFGENRGGEGVHPLVGQDVEKSGEHERVGGERDGGGSHLRNGKHGYIVCESLYYIENKKNIDFKKHSGLTQTKWNP